MIIQASQNWSNEDPRYVLVDRKLTKIIIITLDRKASLALVLMKRLAIETNIPNHEFIGKYDKWDETWFWLEIPDFEDKLLKSKEKI